MKRFVFILFLINGIAFSQTITPRLGLNVDQADHTTSLGYELEGAAYSEPCIYFSYPPYYRCNRKFEHFESDKKSYKWGYHIGANVDYPLFKFLDVEAGIFYTTRGTAYDGVAKNQEGAFRGTFSERTEIHALYFPLSLKFNIKLNNSFKINILAGAYMDVYLSGKRKFKILSNSEEKILDFGKEAYNRYGFSPTFGIGFTYKPFVFRITADGWTNLNDISRKKNISTQSFMFSLGYQFNLKKKQL